MRHSIVLAAAALGGVLALAGCGPGSTPVMSASAPSGNSPSDHTTAATGFGLGPEDFKSNGGAFGPDQADPNR